MLTIAIVDDGVSVLSLFCHVGSRCHEFALHAIRAVFVASAPKGGLHGLLYNRTAKRFPNMTEEGNPSSVMLGKPSERYSGTAIGLEEQTQVVEMLFLFPATPGVCGGILVAQRRGRGAGTGRSSVEGARCASSAKVWRLGW